MESPHILKSHLTKDDIKVGDTLVPVWVQLNPRQQNHDPQLITIVVTNMSDKGVEVQWDLGVHSGEKYNLSWDALKNSSWCLPVPYIMQRVEEKRMVCSTKAFFLDTQ